MALLLPAPPTPPPRSEQDLIPRHKCIAPQNAFDEPIILFPASPTSSPADIISYPLGAEHVERQLLEAWRKAMRLNPPTRAWSRRMPFRKPEGWDIGRSILPASERPSGPWWDIDGQGAGSEDNTHAGVIVATDDGANKAPPLKAGGGGIISLGDSLSLAARRGHFQVVVELLRRGAGTEVEDDWGVYPIHNAAYSGNLALTRALLLAGAAVNSRCSLDGPSGKDGRCDTYNYCCSSPYPLHCASERGHLEVMRELVASGADIEARDCKGRTALHYAAKHAAYEAGMVLIQAGADVSARDDSGATPLHQTLYESEKEPHDWALLLLRAGADVNATNHEGQTPLHHVCEGWDYGAIELLLRWGADETIEDAEGNSPGDAVGEGCQHYCVHGETALVRALLARASDFRDTPWRRFGWLLMLRARVRGAAVEGATTEKKWGDDSSTSGDSMGVTLRVECGADDEWDKQRVAMGMVADGIYGGDDGGDGGDGGRISGADSRGGAAVARTVGLQEEGIFRKILGYL